MRGTCCSKTCLRDKFVWSVWVYLTSKLDCYKKRKITKLWGKKTNTIFTCQEAKEAFAAHIVPDEKGVGHAPIPKLHVDALWAQPHLQVAEFHDWVAVLLLQPISERATAGRKQCEPSENVLD